MTKGKGSARKTQRIVRTPATKFGHLRKKAQAIRDVARERLTTKNAKYTKRG